jgi:hypothetical protein
MSSTHPVRAVRQTEELPRRSWEWADNEGRFGFIFSFVQGWHWAIRIRCFALGAQLVTDFYAAPKFTFA